MSSSRQIETLNELLKGEHIAIDIYDKTKGLQKDVQVAEILADFENDHKQHAELLKKRINDLGGIPRSGTGLSGIMANLAATVNSYRGPGQLVKYLYEGEDDGLRTYEEHIKDFDQVSQDLVRQIITEEHEHLKKFEARMEQEEKEVRGDIVSGPH
ncbi:MAG: ferritin-like domain-containing protein [Desulfitobacteriaceae bacterium]|nr:ferritin-like domain-containing protein [Desulfitobacteriaceae bacterium]MDD4346946.1 ferritin-like domain-containing protein [Desulfitobacteriaceae bacterium]